MDNFIEKKNPEKTYISKSIANKVVIGEQEVNVPIRYVSKVIDSKEELFEVRQKNEIKLRITDGQKQEILAKVYEFNKKIYALTIQKFSTKTGNPHEVSFCFIGEEISKLKNFIESITLLSFKDKEKYSIKDEELDRVYSFLKGRKFIEAVTDEDIIAVGYRKSQLEIFRKLLEKDKNFWTQYRDQEADAFINAKKEEQNSLEKAGLKITKGASEEKTWQYFFTKNQWIFGYGLDYRFQGILQREAQTTDGGCVDGKSGDGFCDYLLADKKFISFVEIKTPNTNLFDNKINRSGSWKLHNDLFDAYSQILEQKASGQVLYNENKKNWQKDGKEVVQKSYDSKVILIIGHWQEIKDCEGKEKNIKEKTFELFRRDSRNVEIITFDELYERADHIVNHR